MEHILVEFQTPFLRANLEEPPSILFMFHSARALIFSRAYREKSHRCLLIALEELFVRQNLLERETLETFREAMDLREEADYGATYSEEGATATMKNARKFLEKTKQILKDLPN